MEAVPLAMYNTYWSLLREALDSLLTCNPYNYKPVSYEQMYSAVYKCVCRQHSERLYEDLMAHLRHQMEAWSAEISQLPSPQLVEQFHKILSQYFFALNSIVPIFTYLNRLYLEPKLDTNLNRELLRIFSEMVADPLMPRIIATLVDAQSTPFTVSPAVMQPLIQNIHSLDKKYVTLNKNLFAKYLVGIGNPMSETDLAAQIEADRLLQESLRRTGFGSGDQSKKRHFSDIPDRGK